MGKEKQKMILGLTDTYGVLERVERNRLFLRLVSGKKLKAECSEKVASSLRGKVGEVVGLRGRAKWTLKGDLRQFRVTEVLSYKGSTALKNVEDLRRKLGGFWTNLDVEEEIRKLRT